MRLRHFSVRKYRSLVATQQLALQRVTTLIGPNNEGKSNILRALVVGMELLSARPTFGFRASPLAFRRGVDRVERYEWERDFPLQLQEEEPGGHSIFEFEFELNPSEMAQFKRETGSTIDGRLPIRLKIGRSNKPQFEIPKRGRGAALARKRESISKFVSSRLRVEYVKTVRTAREANLVVTRMVHASLAGIREEREYKAALAEMQRLHEPALKAIARTVRTSLQQFLPDITDVKIAIDDDVRFPASYDSTRILIDDGVETDIRDKGDGVQSLAALALLRHAATEAAQESEDLLLAIEEPEAHLHPEAIRQVRGVLEDLGNHQQVVITTHSPLLANRASVESNIIVESSRAAPAAAIGDVRDALGVHLADNLQSARLAILVEGDDDRATLSAYLSWRSKLISQQIKAGALVFDVLGGASSLANRLANLTAAACICQPFLDNDAEGKAAVSRAVKRNMVPESQCILTKVGGMHESELEDLVDSQVYGTALSKLHNVPLPSRLMRRSRPKWSARVGECYHSAGRDFGPKSKEEAKQLVSAEIVNHLASGNGDPFQANRRGPIDSLVTAIEGHLSGQ